MVLRKACRITLRVESRVTWLPAPSSRVTCVARYDGAQKSPWSPADTGQLGEKTLQGRITVHASISTDFRSAPCQGLSPLELTSRVAGTPGDDIRLSGRSRALLLCRTIPYRSIGGVRRVGSKNVLWILLLVYFLVGCIICNVRYTYSAHKCKLFIYYCVFIFHVLKTSNVKYDKLTGKIQITR